jgi:hypothetical protein
VQREQERHEEHGGVAGERKQYAGLAALMDSI